jgi:hypothetical protein
MSKFLPDPQVQSLRAMRKGDIAFASGGTVTIGKQSSASVQPLVQKSIIVPAAILAIIALSGTPAGAPTIGVATQTILSVNTAIAISLLTTNALEALSGTPSETPTVGVAFATSVV